MRLLIIGGGVFLGRALVAESRARGHEITLFNRGVSSVDVEPGAKLIKGDRNGDLSAIDGQDWDALIDTCGYYPRQVRSLLTALSGRIGHYTFVSTVSVYGDLSRHGLTESDELGKIGDETTETVTPVTYGPLKALCEAAARQGMPDANLIVRPGVIVGPNDPTDRLAYWVGRIAAGGEVLAAGNPKAPVQMIDVRDLAAWIVAMVETRQTGTFNAVGPKELLTMEQLFTLGAATLNPGTRFVWVDDASLVAHGMTEWMKLPFFVPTAETRFAGMFTKNGANALAHGLRLRPLAETVADTWHWIQDRPGGLAMKTGLTREQEEKLINAWNARLR